MRIHRIILTLLYAATVTTVVLVMINGWEYYNLPQLERPRSDLHEQWKASGFIGHGLGVIGSVLIILLLVYTARKYFKFMHGWGDIRIWLDYHIWMGVTAPLLLTFHSTFKFQGLVGWSYWSMVAVALSGLLGRYLYLQIPRTLSGAEMTANELVVLDEKLCSQIKETHGIGEEVLKKIRQAEGDSDIINSGFTRSNLYWLKHDLMLPFYLLNVHIAFFTSSSLPRSEISKLMRLARRRSLLHRKRTFLRNAQKMFHYWHMVHRPCTMIMFVIMIVHIVITMIFGYWWVLS